MTTSPNPREHIGGNNPPGAIELAEPYIEALRGFLNNTPVIGAEDESRDAKAVLDRAKAVLDSVETERKSKVDPLNAQVKAINTEYHKWHNADAKRPGLWDKLLTELRSRLTAYAREEERKRWEAEERARREAEEADRLAREAADREMEAREAAAAGVCDVDLDAAMADAHTTSQRAMKAMWTAQRAEAGTKVRITGGIGNAVSLKDHETLRIMDWRAAVEEMSGDDGRIPQDIADAILKCARAHRKAFDQLPAGVIATYERSL